MQTVFTFTHLHFFCISLLYKQGLPALPRPDCANCKYCTESNIGLLHSMCTIFMYVLLRVLALSPVKKRSTA